MITQSVIDVLREGVTLPENIFKHSIHDQKGSYALSINHRLRLKAETNGIAYPFDVQFCSLCKKDIITFGEYLIGDAKRCLPEYVQWGEGKKLSLNQLVQKWKDGRWGTRLEIGRTLAEQLHPSHYEDGTPFDNQHGQDSYNQPRNRVLPNLYGKWVIEKGASNIPNCIGKFQLLIAFGKLCGTKMLAISPLTTSSEKLNVAREKVSKRILACYQKTGIQLDPKRLTSLLKTALHTRSRMHLPPLQHFAVIYEIDPERWLLVDPNCGLASVMDESSLMSIIHHDLSCMQHTCPGGTILYQKTTNDPYEEYWSETCAACDTVERLTRTLEQTKNWYELKKILFTEKMVSSLIGDDIQIGVESLDRRLDTSAYRFWKKHNPSCPENLDHVSSEEFQELKNTIIYRFLVSQEVRMLTNYSVEKSLGQVSHPLSEISLPLFRAASSTISHVALDLSEEPEAAAETERFLYRFGIAEAHLYNVLCTGDRCDDHAQRAKEILALQPAQGQLLKGFFEGKGVRNA